jgi:hypothetical protein
MFFAPFPLLFTWLFGLLSLALFVGGAYPVWVLAPARPANGPLLRRAG